MLDESPREALMTAERDEPGSRRRRLRTLEQEQEILKKAAAFFAKESDLRFNFVHAPEWANYPVVSPPLRHF